MWLIFVSGLWLDWSISYNIGLTYWTSQQFFSNHFAKIQVFSHFIWCYMKLEKLWLWAFLFSLPLLLSYNELYIHFIAILIMWKGRMKIITIQVESVICKFYIHDSMQVPSSPGSAWILHIWNQSATCCGFQNGP